MVAQNASLPSWRLHIIPRGPANTFGMLHEPEHKSGKIALFVPGAIEGAILTGRQDFNPLADALDQAGISLMVLQMSAAVLTTATAVFESCLGDIAAGVALAKSLGYDEIVLIGLSLGGPRVMYYMHHEGRREPAIKMMVFLASIASPYEASSRSGGEAGLAAYEAGLERARAALAAGRPDEVIVGRPIGFSLALTAKGYLSFFGNPHECDASTLKFADCIKVPAAVVHGEQDDISAPSQAHAIHAALEGAPTRELIFIPDCAHHALAPGDIARRTSAALADCISRTLQGRP